MIKSRGDTSFPEAGKLEKEVSERRDAAQLSVESPQLSNISLEGDGRTDQNPEAKVFSPPPFDPEPLNPDHAPQRMPLRVRPSQDKKS